jgi:hypothetical protein
VEEALLQQGVDIFGRRHPCKIALLVGSKSCAEVGAMLATLGAHNAEEAPGGAEDGPQRKRRRFGGRKATVTQVRGRRASAAVPPARCR